MRQTVANVYLLKRTCSPLFAAVRADGAWIAGDRNQMPSGMGYSLVVPYVIASPGSVAGGLALRPDTGRLLCTALWTCIQQILYLGATHFMLSGYSRAPSAAGARDLTFWIIAHHVTVLVTSRQLT